MYPGAHSSSGRRQQPPPPPSSGYMPYSAPYYPQPTNGPPPIPYPSHPGPYYSNNYNPPPPPPPQQQQQQPYYTPPPPPYIPPPQQSSSNLPIIRRRKALLIGINYFNTNSELRGCISDVHRMKQFISTTFGFSTAPDAMVCLTDDNPDPNFQPTRYNIINAMHWLVAGAQPGDSLFFHYSGHGGEVPDLDGDEEDGFDETILPIDHERAGQIIDDEMHDILIKPLLPGVRLTAIFDSCHSGTALDLPYIYGSDGNLKKHNKMKLVAQKAGNIGMSYLKGGVIGAVSALMNTPTRLGNPNIEQQKGSSADAIMFSGCKDSQTSADASINGQFTGAMSFAFITALSQNPRQSFLELMLNTRRILQRDYSQVPQMSSSRPMQMEYPFIM